MHATTVKNKITQRDNYKEIMSVIVVVLLLTLTLVDYLLTSSQPHTLRKN
ncbi:hypothetical protein DOE06_19755 [Escherichia coli]|nr:hypothetical protein [Escherichia coli]